MDFTVQNKSLIHVLILKILGNLSITGKKDISPFFMFAYDLKQQFFILSVCFANKKPQTL